MNRVNFFFYTTQNYGSLNKIGSRRIVKKKNFKFWVNSFEWITFKIIDQPMKFKYWGLTLCFISLSVWVRTKKKKKVRSQISDQVTWKVKKKSEKRTRLTLFRLVRLMMDVEKINTLVSAFFENVHPSLFIRQVVLTCTFIPNHYVNHL